MMTDEQFVADLDAQFNTGMAPKKEYPAIPVTNEDGTPRIYTLKVREVGTYDGTDFNTHEPTKNYKFFFDVQDEDQKDREVTMITAMVMKRNSASYRAAPSAPNKLLDLWLKCNKDEPKAGESVSVKSLIGKSVRAELSNKEKEGSFWPRIERLFLAK